MGSVLRFALFPPHYITLATRNRRSIEHDSLPDSDHRLADVLVAHHMAPSCLMLFAVNKCEPDGRSCEDSSRMDSNINTVCIGLADSVASLIHPHACAVVAHRHPSNSRRRPSDGPRLPHSLPVGIKLSSPTARSFRLALLSYVLQALVSFVLISRSDTLDRKARNQAVPNCVHLSGVGELWMLVTGLDVTVYASNFSGNDPPKPTGTRGVLATNRRVFLSFSLSLCAVILAAVSCSSCYSIPAKADYRQRPRRLPRKFLATGPRSVA